MIMTKPVIVVLTGAGISAESGLSTFRAENGLWEGEDVNQVATYEGYKTNPGLVHQFYNKLRAKLKSSAVKPNAAHYAIAELEKVFGSDNVIVITQNVDNLHERAGSTGVIHMHGELLKIRDEKTGNVFECHQDIDHQKNPDLRPHIVWFGEIPLGMERIYDALAKADYFISIGTSGNVYPAASFVEIARNNGCKTIELNLEPGVSENLFNEKIYGTATEVVPAFVNSLIKTYFPCSEKKAADSF